MMFRDARMKSVCCVAVGAVLLMSSGCGRGTGMPPTTAVSGTVTLQGKPAGGVEVYFVNERLVSFGKTDSQGRYNLVQGAVAGENKVYFSKIEGNKPGFEMQEGMDDYQMQMALASGGKRGKMPKQVIPAEYSDPVNPKLSVTVPSGGTDSADFKL